MKKKNKNIFRNTLKAIGLVLGIGAVSIGGYYGIDYLKHRQAPADTTIEVTQDDKDQTILDLQALNEQYRTQILGLQADVNQKNANIASLTTERLNIIRQVNELNEHLDTVNAQLIEKTNALNQANASITSLTADKSQLQADVTRLTAEKQALQSQLDALIEELAEKTTALDEARATIEELQASNNELLASIDTLTSAKESLQTQLATAQSDLESLQASYDALNETQISEKQALQTQINEKQQLIESLQASIEEKDAEIESLQAQLNENVLTITTLSLQVGRGNTAIADIERFIAYVSGETEEEPVLNSTEVQQLYDLCMQAMSEAEEELTMLDAEVTRLSGINNSLTSTINDLNSQIEQKDAEIVGYLATIDELENDCDQLLLDKQDLQSDLTKANETMADLNSQLAIANEELVQKNAQITTLNTRIAQLEEQVESGTVDGWKIDEVYSTLDMLCLDFCVDDYTSYGADIFSKISGIFLKDVTFTKITSIAIRDFARISNFDLGLSATSSIDFYYCYPSGDLETNITFINSDGSEFDFSAVDEDMEYITSIDSLDYIIDRGTSCVESFNAVIVVYPVTVTVYDVSYCCELFMDDYGELTLARYSMLDPGEISDLIIPEKINDLDVFVDLYFDTSSLTSIRFLSSKPQEIFGTEEIYNINTIYIPQGSLEAYTGAYIWDIWLSASEEHQFVEYDVEEYLASLEPTQEVGAGSDEVSGGGADLDDIE